MLQFATPMPGSARSLGIETKQTGSWSAARSQSQDARLIR